MDRVLIVMGWIGSIEMFSPIIKEFSNSNIKVVDFNIISSREDVVKRVVENIVEYNPNIIIAWSMGSLAVLKALEIVESSSRVILISPTSKFTSREYGWRNLVIDSMIKSIKINKNLVIEKFCTNMFCKGEEKYLSEVIENVLLNSKNTNINDLINSLLFLKYEEAYKIGELKNETLIIHGREDFICSVRGGEYIKGEMKNSFLKVIDKCGHAPFITRKEEVINIINTFLSGGIYDK